MQFPRCGTSEGRIFFGAYFDLDPINSDQGKLLVALSGFSISHPRNQPTPK
jgi:hypothetical protein